MKIKCPQVQYYAKALSNPLMVYIFLGKLEIDVEIYQSIHKYENILKGKNRVCKIIMSLKVNI